MQESLDEALAPAEKAELRQHLDSSVRDAQMYERLQQVDTMLRNAPHERAPRRLAALIMARIAEVAEQMDPRLSRVSGLALGLGLGLVAGVMLPLLVLAGWLMLTALGSGAGMVAAIERVVALLAVVMGLAEHLLLELRAFLAAHPGLLALMLGMIPVSLLWLFRFAPRKRATDAV
jgi:ferric-dicitrate binding protein FerR (iron transport regulator)